MGLSGGLPGKLACGKAGGLPPTDGGLTAALVGRFTGGLEAARASLTGGIAAAPICCWWYGGGGVIYYLLLLLIRQLGDGSKIDSLLHQQFIKAQL